MCGDGGKAKNSQAEISAMRVAELLEIRDLQAAVWHRFHSSALLRFFKRLLPAVAKIKK